MVSAEGDSHEDQRHRPQNGGDDNQGRCARGHGGEVCNGQGSCGFKDEIEIMINKRYDIRFNPQIHCGLPVRPGTKCRGN